MTGGQEILGLGVEGVGGSGGPQRRVRAPGSGCGGEEVGGQNNKIVLSSQLHARGLLIRRKRCFNQL